MMLQKKFFVNYYMFTARYSQYIFESLMWHTICFYEHQSSANA
jgi:hypothetical protein